MDTYTPFTYLVRFKPTGQLYYGSKYAAGCHPGMLWTTYFTSLETIQELVELHGPDSFDVRVTRTFYTANEARDWEAKFLKRVGAAKSPIWFNRSNGSSGFINAGPMDPSVKKRKLHLERLTKIKNGTYFKRGPYKNKGTPIGPRGKMGDAARIERNAKMMETRARNGTRTGLSRKFLIKCPAGFTYEGSSLKEFCAEHDISLSSMQKVCRGAYTSYLGWTGHWVD